MPEITLHVLAMSHPCMATERALKLKGLDYERIDMEPGKQVPIMEEVYGEGNTTVPGAVIDGEPIHGSRAIFDRIEQLAPEPSLYPEPMAEEIREAERWGDQEFQHLGRHLGWGALHFRPEAVGTLFGGPPLDPAGTDFAIRLVRGAWKYHGLSAELIAQGLASLPEKLDHIDELAERGVILGDQPNAADLQIGATARVLVNGEDLKPLLAGRAAEQVGLRWFPDYPGRIPAGAFPAGWVPEPPG